MEKRNWINILMVIFIACLFLTTSCAKKTVVSDASKIEDQVVQEEQEAKEIQEAKAQKIKEQELKESRLQAAKKRFENQDIHFAYDSSELSSMAKIILGEKAQWLNNNYSETVIIEGHCDERGTIEYNLALGERRAQSAKAYLVNLGISASRLKTLSYGEEKPIASGENESSYKKNRRAHFVLK